MTPKNTNQNKPIGIFDSGIGGLTVAAEIFMQSPSEDVVYFGDTGRYPYGPRSENIVKKFSRQNANFLIKKKVKLIVVACNTASAYALNYLKRIYGVPIIGVVLPGAAAAAALTKNKKIGVIGTQGTISSGSYQKALKKIDGSLKIAARACPLFVALAEEGYTQKPASKLIAKDYLSELKNKNIDTLVLGCTHYPLLRKTISGVMGKKVRLVDSAEQTAAVVKFLLKESNLANPQKRSGEKKFYVSDSPKKFKQLGERFLGKRIAKVELIDINSY